MTGKAKRLLRKWCPWCRTYGVRPSSPFCHNCGAPASTRYDFVPVAYDEVPDDLRRPARS